MLLVINMNYCCSARLLFINNDMAFDRSPTVTVNPPGITKPLSLAGAGGAAVLDIDSVYNLFRITFVGLLDGNQYRAIYSIATYSSQSGVAIALNSISCQNEYPNLIHSETNKKLGLKKVSKIAPNAWNTVLGISVPVLKWKLTGNTLICVLVRNTSSLFPDIKNQ